MINDDFNNDYDISSKVFEKSNYICVDQSSQFVVASNIRFTVKISLIKKSMLYC